MIQDFPFIKTTHEKTRKADEVLQMTLVKQDHDAVVRVMRAFYKMADSACFLRSLVLFQKQNMLKLAKFLLKLVSSCFTAKTILNLIALDVKSLIFF
jgi:hypothetical protein